LRFAYWSSRTSVVSEAWLVVRFFRWAASSFYNSDCPSRYLAFLAVTVRRRNFLIGWMMPVGARVCRRKFLIGRPSALSLTMAPFGWCAMVYFAFSFLSSSLARPFFRAISALQVSNCAFRQTPEGEVVGEALQWAGQRWEAMYSWSRRRA